jgi:site-specific DNA-methyltransferase (adenine-specific)
MGERGEYRLIHEDARNLLDHVEARSVNLIFADPPYFLSNGGISCSGGKMVSVNKGGWDKSKGLQENTEFTREWLRVCHELLTEDGSIWISGTHHNIYTVGQVLQELGFHILNEVIWFKPNGPPHLACRQFTHSHETLIWARKNKNSRHYFNYEFSKTISDSISPQGKQTRSVWTIPLTPTKEKLHGKHPTQKPEELLRRIVLSSSREGDLVLDPFVGSGTTGVLAVSHGRRFFGSDLEKEYIRIAQQRIATERIWTRNQKRLRILP